MQWKSIHQGSPQTNYWAFFVKASEIVMLSCLLRNDPCLIIVLEKCGMWRGNDLSIAEVEYVMVQATVHFS
ncbi:MAG TPA: hypothetical protein DEA71_17525 [Nitrospira sp.]|nr:hypothetical protein [Nitrospira sp.]